MHLEQLFLLLLMLKLMLLLLLGGGQQRVHELLEVAIARVDNAVAGEQLLLRQLVRVRRERRRVALAPAAAGHRFGANCAPRNAGQTYSTDNLTLVLVCIVCKCTVKHSRVHDYINSRMIPIRTNGWTMRLLSNTSE